MLEILIACLFLLFHKSVEIVNFHSLTDSSVDFIGVTEVKKEQWLDVKVKGGREMELFVMHFFCPRMTQNVSFL